MTTEEIVKGFSSLTQMPLSVNVEEKKKNIKNWKDNLNERKMTYFLKYKNEKMSEIYERWYQSEPPVVPKKLKAKQIPGETEEQKKVRLELSCDKMRCEANIMKIRAENYAIKLARITDEVSKEIFKSYEENSDTANQPQELWKRECRSEEEKSARIWSDKEEFFTKVEMEETGGKETGNFQNRPVTQNNHNYQGHSNNPKKKNSSQNYNNIPGQRRQYRCGDFQQVRVRGNFWNGQRQQYFPSSWPNQQSFQSHRFPNGHQNYSEDETLPNLMEEQEEQMKNQNQSFPARDQQSQT